MKYQLIKLHELVSLITPIDCIKHIHKCCMILDLYMYVLHNTIIK